MILYSYEDQYDDEENDSYAWDDFKDNTSAELENLSYPVTLEAINSNWRGQTGYAEVDNFDNLIKEVASFDSSFIELHKEDDEYYFKLATHDVPTGFCIYITQGEE
jgi:hypothetical protein